MSPPAIGSASADGSGSPRGSDSDSDGGSGSPSGSDSDSDGGSGSPSGSDSDSDSDSDDRALLDEVCRIGASLHARGYVHATAGNISVRTAAGGFVITPTDACLGTLQPGRLAVVDAQGRQTAGDRASKTLALHRRIYEAEPEARCIIHTHATHCVALSLAGVWNADDIVPPITPYFVMKVGHVPLVPYRRPGDPEVAELVVQRIAAMRERGAPLRAVMLDRLGPVAWHDSPASAGAVLEELEETARLWLLTRAAALPEDRIDELRRHFGARW